MDNKDDSLSDSINNQALDSNSLNVESSNSDDTKIVSNNAINTNETIKSTSLSRSLVETLIYIFISIVIILLLRTFVVQHVRVDGTSMDPTLEDNEHLLIEKLSYRFDDVQRFDIIVFRPYESNSDILYVKRVIGIPHDTVFIENGSIYINGSILDEDFGGTTLTEPKDLSEPMTLGDDEYFVLGDNRSISQDSRSSMVGKVSRDSIVGKAWFVIYPFNRIGLVDHE